MGGTTRFEIPSRVVSSVAELQTAIQKDTTGWPFSGNERPWFRGQKDAGVPPIPSVLREGYRHSEFDLTTAFRLKAPSLGRTPETSRLDQWLFLMQHYGLPTRLLDWTESPLLACLFAVEEVLFHEKCNRNYRSDYLGIWAMQPLELNDLSGSKVFPNTWKQSRVLENFKIAFGTAGKDKTQKPGGGWRTFRPLRYPVAVQPSAVDARVAVQRSCFTVHGTDSRDFESLLIRTRVVKSGFFRKYLIHRSRSKAILTELDRLGISFSTLYPDMAGLAKELKFRFKN